MNLFSLPPSFGPEEELAVLWERPGARVERIVSSGHSSPPSFWYDQEEDEWLAVLAGTGEVEFADGRKARLSAGDTLLIPAHARHRVSFTSTEPPCVWLCFFVRPDMREYR